MSALRVVLIAEGNGELRSDPLRGPLSAIHADDQGPGHVIFARAIAARSSVPRAAVHFIEPLRTMRATIARGSSLLHRKTLRQLLNFQPVDLPDLVIVLVDADGETSRKRDLEAMVSDMPGTKMIAVAIQEFEACWSRMGLRSSPSSPVHRRRFLSSLNLSDAARPRGCSKIFPRRLWTSATRD